jgi:hypothetical protein
VKLIYRVVALATIATIVAYSQSSRSQVPTASQQLTLRNVDLKQKNGSMKKVGSAL